MSERPALGQTLRAARTRLDPVTETPRLDAELLLAHTLGITRAQLLTRLDRRLETEGFEAALLRRLNHEPIAYITGTWEFYSMDLQVRPPALVPRPETEHLVETVLAELPDTEARVLDLCTGSGCVALAVAKNAPRCSVTATDIRPENLAIAAGNARRHGLSDRVRFRQGDLFGALTDEPEPFHVVCSNPPYVETGEWECLPPVIRLHEDPGALLAGADGLDVVRRLVGEAPNWLLPGGTLAFEIGFGQHEAVRKLLQSHDYRGVSFGKDLAGIDRIAVGRIPR